MYVIRLVPRRARRKTSRPSARRISPRAPPQCAGRPVPPTVHVSPLNFTVDALKLVAKKLQSSLAVEGELPEDGLSAYGDDLMLALAPKIVNGDADDAESVEAAFAQARDAEATAEELLVDDGWKLVESEPEAVAVNSLPRTGYGGNGQHEPTGPTVELVPANGNGHHDEAPEPQQSLFSWGSSWPGSRRSPRAGPGSRSPRPSRCSSGR